MEQPTYRAAVIGTGGIGYSHAGYYAKDPRTTLVAAADIRPQALSAFGEKVGIGALYADYRELLEKERPDLVSICTWTGTHPEISIAAAEAGVRGILCEKPMSPHLGNARRMVAACAALGVPLAVHHQHRFIPANVAARRLVAEGAIGRPLAAAWRATGGLLNNGSHGVDLIRYVLGDPPAEWVMAQLERRTNRYERGTLIEDRIVLHACFEGGCHLTLEADMEAKPASGWWILGTEGVLRQERGKLTLQGRAGIEEVAADAGPTPLEELIAWVEGGPEPRNAGRITLASHEVLMAAYESARTRARVSLPLGPEVDRSPIYAMSDEGALPVTGERYDIRSVDALRYVLEREGIALTGGEHLEGEGSWSGAALPGQSR